MIALAWVVLACGPSGRVASPDARAPERGCDVASRLVDPTGALSIAAVDVDVVVEGPIARTVAELALANASARDELARLLLALPDGAVVRRLELEVGGVWQTADAQPRVAARDAFEGIVARRIDPAIAEQTGDALALEVFPVVRTGVTRVRLTWLQPLVRDDTPVVVPLCGLPTIERLHVAIDERVGGHHRTRELTRRNARVVQPFHIDLAGERPSAIRDGRWVAARVQLDPRPEGRDPIPGLTIVVDTSSSRRDRLADDVRALAALADALRAREPTLPVQLVAFDRAAVVVLDGSARELPAAVAGLRARGAIGATDLHGALAWVIERGPHPRVVLATDGAATLGELDPRRGRDLLARLRAAGVVRIDLLGAASSGPLPRWLADRGVAAGRVLDVDGRGLLAGLERSVPRASLEVPTGDVVGPAQWIDGVVEGLVFVELAAGRAWRATGRGARVDVPQLATTEDLVVPLVVAAEIDALVHEIEWLPQGDPARAALLRRAEQSALAHGLVSPRTSLLAVDPSAQFGGRDCDRRPGASPCEEFRALEREAEALARQARDDEADEADYVRALEAWVLSASRGPRPRRDDPEFVATRQARLHRRMHDEADQGERSAAPWDLVRRARGHDESAELAHELLGRHARSGDRIELAYALVELARQTGRTELAARAASDTVEVGPADPWYRAGALALDPTVHAAAIADLLGPEPDCDSLVWAILALARGGAHAGVAALDDALASGAPIVVVAANSGELVLALEDPEHRGSWAARELVRGPIEVDMAGRIVGAIAAARPGTRVLVHCPRLGTTPIVGAIYVLERSADGRVHIEHRAFVLPRCPATRTLSL